MLRKFIYRIAPVFVIMASFWFTTDASAKVPCSVACNINWHKTQDSPGYNACVKYVCPAIEKGKDCKVACGSSDVISKAKTSSSHCINTKCPGMKKKLDM
ncbi:MAG: hypothetical protein HOI80_02940 [Alphaproteobacteria bacterium]|jgi:hypothetical protein|nr:hypothetical protein [Alphaproteobacteria bacterium]MBT5389334.1 hypothetical protein [Alphaproteobacteria bacterium]MBT5540180.1 hypothetical protein [Alphaproteobacteria bacterium]MBT5654439.1 hypothetical protein [Alphaproteobacteria bacterium]